MKELSGRVENWSVKCKVIHPDLLNRQDLYDALLRKINPNEYQLDETHVALIECTDDDTEYGYVLVFEDYLGAALQPSAKKDRTLYSVLVNRLRAIAASRKAKYKRGYVIDIT